MELDGHVGAALTAYSPLYLAVLHFDYPRFAVLGTIIAIALASLPDCDLRLSTLQHRGPTHTVQFALVVGVIVGCIGATLTLFNPGGVAANPLVVGTFCSVVALGTILSHIAVDALTPMGVDPLATGRRYSFVLCYAADRRYNYAMFGTGVCCLSIMTVLVTVF